MPDINLKKDKIPFLVGGDSVLNVHLAVSDPTQMLPADTGDLLSVSFKGGGSQPFSVGGSDNVKLGIDAEASASLAPYWSTSGDRLKALEPYGLMNYFDGGHDDRLLLALALGGKAGADLSGKFKYSALTAEASLKAGADAAYVLVRSFPADKPAGELITDFFHGLRLPSDVDGPLADDEVLIFEYGGYLNFAASVGAGYELSGSHGVKISELKFVEKYSFSLLAKLGLTAGVAGRFRIEVRAGSAPGWARVVVKKSRSKSFSIAADVTAGASFESEGLPESSDEFVNALLGVNSKNWLSLFNQVKDLSDFDTLRLYLDKLAQSFIEEYTGKAFDELAKQPKLDEALALIQKAAQQYRDVGDRAVTLFDKYFDAAAGVVDARLTDALDFIKNAATWDAVKAKINDRLNDPRLSGSLWAVVNQLTDGDPLGWMLGKVKIEEKIVDSLEALKERADKAIALVRDAANAEIRKLITLAKSKFPFDSFVGELAGLDWVKLKAMTDKRLVGFVERVIGDSITKLSNSELGDAVRKFHDVLEAVDGFKEKLFGKDGLAEQVLNSSFQFKLHAEYNRAGEENALLDVEFDLGTATGRELMRKAGMGDFLGVVKGYDAGAAKLNEGALTHKATRETKLAVNLTGWHLDWNYESLSRIITESEQRFVPGPNGTLTVLTTVSATKEKEVSRHGERVYTNMVLRFLGESSGVLESNPAGTAYLVDAVTGMDANYQLVFNDPETTRHELAQYLSFADDFGIAASDEAAEAALEPYLIEEAGSVGATSVTYRTAFTEEGLRSLFAQEFSDDDERSMRKAARLIVLGNYLRKSNRFPEWGWCYWSESLYNTWKKEGPNFLQSSAWTVPVSPSPLKNLQAPTQLVLHKSDGGIQLVYTLYSIEQSLVKGMRALSQAVRAGKRLDPRDFQKKLQDFTDALDKFDSFDEGLNTVFAMFDKLIQRSVAGKPYRASSLEVKITQDGTETTKVLVA
jgi:hypothetical protein